MPDQVKALCFSRAQTQTINSVYIITASANIYSPKSEACAGRMVDFSDRSKYILYKVNHTSVIVKKGSIMKTLRRLILENRHHRKIKEKHLQNDPSFGSKSGEKKIENVN